MRGDRGGRAGTGRLIAVKGRVLIVAGSDSGAGAGIQADVKTVMALGGYGLTAVTALTAQNTLGVQGVFPVPAAFVRRQMQSVLDDIGADAAKTGMLGEAALIGTVADVLAGLGVPVVVDPVMVAKGGHVLLGDDAMRAMASRLIPLAAVMTPNIPEAEALSGRSIRCLADQEAAALALLGMGAQAVLVKGGHLEGDVVTDVLARATGLERFAAARLDTRHTHGTGCTLASAIAVCLAQGLDLAAAVRRARRFVRAAIMAAPGLGAGHGPLDHGAWRGGEPA